MNTLDNQLHKRSNQISAKKTQAIITWKAIPVFFFAFLWVFAGFLTPFAPFAPETKVAYAALTPTVRAVGTIAAGTAAISPALPTGTIAGDLLIMFVENSGEAAQTATGWTELDYQAITGSSLTVLYKIAAGSDATTTNDVGDHQIARIIGITGGTFDVNNPFGAGTLVMGTQASGTAKTIGGMTTTSTDSLVFSAIAGDLPDATGTANWTSFANTSLTTVTERIDNSTNVGHGGSVGVATGIRAATGTLNSTTVTAASARTTAHMMFAVKGSPNTTTIGTGTDAATAVVAPGAAIRDAGAFTFQANTGTDSITALTVVLEDLETPYNGVSEVRITNSAGSTTYFSAISNPSSNTLNFSGGTPIPVTTTSVTFKIRITAKTHVNMPVPQGEEYVLSPYVSAFTSTNVQAGSDTNANALIIDNLSTGNVTDETLEPENTQVRISWSNPGDADLFGAVVLRRAGSVVTDAPVEGVTYTTGNTIGSSTVVCVVTATTCLDTGLDNNLLYHYKIFTRDTNGNYSTGLIPANSPADPDPTIESRYADSHITGNFTNPNNAIGISDDIWAGDLNTSTSVTSMWSMEDPSAPISGTQEIRVLVKKGSNSGDPTIALNLYENGVLVQSILTNTSITSTTGQTVVGTFDASVISNPANVQIEVVMTAAGGGPSARNSAQIDRIRWLVTLAVQVTFSGRLFSDEGTTGLSCASNQISYSVNGAASTNVTCGDSPTGSYSFSAIAVNGAVITVFLNTNGGNKAVTVTRTNGIDLSGLDLYQNRLIVRHADSGPITNTNLDNFDSVQDSDIPFTVTSSNLTVASGTKLIVWTGKTFTPGGTVTTTASSNAASETGDLLIQSSATLTMGTDALSIGGDFTNLGAISTSSGHTTTFTATATGHTITFNNGTQRNITFNGVGGGWTSSGNVTIDSVLTITAGTFNAGNSTITLSGSGTPFVNNGTFTYGTSTIQYTTTGGANVTAINMSNSSGGTNGYYNLEIKPSNGTAHTLGTASSQTIGVAGNLTIGNGTNAGATASTHNPTIIVVGIFNIAVNATYTASTGTLTVGDDFDNDGTFTHSSGTVVLNTTATADISGNNTVFSALTIATPGKTVRFTATQEFKTEGLLTITGSSGNNVIITSTTGSSAWTIDHQGTESVTYATVSWSACHASTTVITATGGTNTDGGNNGVCWVFTAGGITISGTVYQSDGTTVYASTPLVRIKVGGLGSYTTTAAANGTFTISSVTIGSAGDVITIYLDTEGGAKGVTVTRAADTSTAITGLDIYQNTLIVRHEDAGPITNTNLSQYMSTNDSDIPFTVTIGNLTLLSGERLLVWSGKTFTPGGSVTTTASTNSAQVDGDITIQSGATLNIAGNAFNIGGDFANFGTFTVSSGQNSTFTAATSGHTISNSGSGNFQNMTFNNTGTWSFLESTFTTLGDVNIYVGSVQNPSSNWNIGGGWYVESDFNNNNSTLTFTATTTGHSVTGGGLEFYNLIFNGLGGGWTLGGLVLGNVTISAGTLGCSNGESMIVRGSLTGNGALNCTNNTTFIGSVGNSSLGGNTAWTFADLEFGTGSVGTTTAIGTGSITITGQLSIYANYTLNAGAKTLIITGNGIPFVVNGAGAQFNADTSTVSFNSAATTGTVIPALSFYNLTLNAASNTFTAATGTLNIGNDLVITAGTFNTNTNDPTVTIVGNLTNNGTISASDSAALTLNGNFTNNGTFTHNNGTVTLVSIAANGETNLAGSNGITFYNLTNITPDTTVKFKFGNAYVIDGTLTVTGAKGNPIWLMSDVAGSQWTITFNGSAPLSYVNVRDGACSGGVTLSGNNRLYDQGNNGSCWGFIRRGGGGSSNAPVDGGGSGSGGGVGGGGSGGGSIQAAATANITDGIVISISVTQGGSGYLDVPTVCFQSASGINAAANASILTGAIISITVTNGGSGYSTAPIVVIASPPGGGGGCGGTTGGGSGGGGGAAP